MYHNYACLYVRHSTRRSLQCQSVLTSLANQFKSQPMTFHRTLKARN
jgi:hypothetical protein